MPLGGRCEPTPAKPEPDWAEVQALFTTYGTIRKWIYDHWSVLELFELPRLEAVVWQKQGWRNWHATVVESLVHTGHNECLGIWVGTAEDKGGEYIALLDELNWLSEDLSLPADLPNLERSRAAIWSRLQNPYCAFAPGTPPGVYSRSNGWVFLDSFDLWVHLAHLRSECAAAKRMLDPQSALIRGVFPVIGSGPGYQRRFYWKGKSASFANQPNLFRLCKALWDDRLHRPYPEREASDVIDYVWQYGGGNSETLMEHVKRVRSAFDEAGLAITIVVPRGADVLWLEERPE